MRSVDAWTAFDSDPFFCVQMLFDIFDVLIVAIQSNLLALLSNIILCNFGVKITLPEDRCV